MKKILFAFLMTLSFMVSKAQMVSVQGGNVTYKGKNYGLSQVEVSGHITKELTAVGTYSKVLAGQDMSTVGLRHAAWKNNLGFMVAGCYLQNHKFEPIFGVDVKISEQIRLAFTSSFNDRLRTIGLKAPIYRFNNKH
jgi:hypothetical protein